MGFPICLSRQTFCIHQKLWPWFMPKMASFIHIIMWDKTSWARRFLFLYWPYRINLGIFPFDMNIWKGINPETHLQADIFIMGLLAGITPFTRKFDSKMFSEKLNHFLWLLTLWTNLRAKHRIILNEFAWKVTEYFAL